jgi:hypothetical protein
VADSKRNGGRKRNDKGRTQEIAERAVEQMQNLIDRPIEAVTGLEKDGEEWTVTLEVLELQRVPSTTDVLGKYEVTLDGDGELTGLQRTRRYARAEAGEV